MTRLSLERSFTNTVGLVQIRAWQQTLQRFVHWSVPALVFGLWSIVLAMLFYAQPFVRGYDVGTDTTPLSGVYGAERNAEFNYVFSRGDSQIVLPRVGNGRYIARLQIGGPGGALPIKTQLRSGPWHVDLEPVSQLRQYHLLVETDANGDFNLDVLSATVHFADDVRPLGVLFDRVSVASTQGIRVPWLLLLTLPVVMLGMTAILCQRIRPRWQMVAALVAGSTALGLAVGLSRGVVALQPVRWFVAGTLFGVIVFSTSRFQGWSRVHPFVAITGIYLVWRLGMWVVALLAVWYSQLFMPLGEALSRDGLLYDRTDVLWHGLIRGWTLWDGENYLAIARTGYTFLGERWPNIAFFPLYPLLIRLVAPLTGFHYEVAAVLVSQVSFCAALIVLYDLLSSDFDVSTAYRTTFCLLVIPTACFFAGGYSESLALALLITTVWAIRRQHWWLAGIAGMLLALSRLPGVLVGPIIALFYIQAQGWHWRSIRLPILASLLPAMGLGAFMLYQWQRFGTPFAFMLAQERWENHLSMPWVLPQAIIDHIEIGRAWPNLVMQGVFWLAFAVLGLLALRRLPLVYGLTAAAVLVPPYLSSWPWSISRHVLLAFPAFIVLGHARQHPRTFRWMIGVMLAAQIIVTLLFINGFWVA